MAPIYSHTPAELAELERSTGLHLLCWIDPQDGGPLLPVLARAEQAARAHQLRAMRRLNGRAALAEAAQVEGPPAAA